MEKKKIRYVVYKGEKYKILNESGVYFFCENGRQFSRTREGLTVQEKAAKDPKEEKEEKE